MYFDEAKIVFSTDLFACVLPGNNMYKARG